MNQRCYSFESERALIFTRSVFIRWERTLLKKMRQYRFSDVTFFELKTTVFCVQCELLSYNNSSKCLACGSTALLSLSRVLGGSLRQEEQARLIGDEVINRVVENIFSSNDVGREAAPASASLSSGTELTTVGAEMGVTCRTLPHSLPQLQPAMRWIVERAYNFTRADGVALAMSRQGRLVCHAHVGSSVPDLGVEVDLNRGISGLCARTGVSWRCDASDSDPRVDRSRCRDLGVQSVLATPVTHLNSVLGVLEVFSSQKNAFSDHDAATVQLLAGMLVIAITRGGRSLSSSEQAQPAMVRLAG